MTVLARRRNASATRSALLDGLADVWQLNEASGTRYGAAGGNRLTPLGTVTRVAGKVDWAAQFTAADLSYLTGVSHSSVQLGNGTRDTGWWMWAWVKFDSLPASDQRMALIAKEDSTYGVDYSLALVNNSGASYGMLLTVRGEGTVNHIVANPGTSWHLAESWYDPVARTLNVAWDGGAPTSVSGGPGGWSKAAMSLGARYLNLAHLDGSLCQPTLRKAAPRAGERAVVWNGGNGTAYPFVPPTVGSATVTIDNTGGASPIAAGTPVPVWVGADFPWWRLYYGNGDDLLNAWPEDVDRGNRFGRLWVAAPVGGVAAGGTANVTVGFGASSRQASANYDTMFSKRIADADTVALFHCDTIASDATASTTGGYSMSLVGSPTVQAADGGNFRVSKSRKAFSSGKHLTFNGSSQYATIPGLLDSPPAAGCVHLWVKLDEDATPGDRLFAKINAYSGTTITEGLEVFYDSQGSLIARITAGGVQKNAMFETAGAPGFPHPAAGWAHVVVSWGTKLRLIVNGYLHAQAAHTGAWGNNSGGTPFTIAARLLDSADSFAPVSVDEIEVRDTEPNRPEYLSWFNRGGHVSSYEYDRWETDPTNPKVDNTAHTAGEPRLQRLGPNSYVGIHGAGTGSEANLYRMWSTDGRTISHDETPIMGNGAGGWAGNACRGSLFLDDDGEFYMFFSDSIPTTGGSIHYATTPDNGTTWEHQGVLVGPDAEHGGWANSTVAKVGETYYWLIEYSVTGGSSYSTAHFRSSSILGPLELVDDDIIALTMQVGTGHYSVGRMLHIGGKFHHWQHGSKSSNLPSVLFHAVSDDCIRWDIRGGGEPVREIDFQVLNRQDQTADSYVYDVPESGEVVLMHDVVDNHGGGGVAAICHSTFEGELSDLAVEYPHTTVTY